MNFKLKTSNILVFGGLKNHRTPVRLSSTKNIMHAAVKSFIENDL
jgi:hypothetical protein